MDGQTGVQPVTATPETTTTSVQAAQPTEQIAIQQDPSGVRRVVRIPATEKSAESTSTPNAEQDPVDGAEQKTEQQPAVAETKEYTPEEIAATDDIRTLDPKRIPTALQPAYKAMVAGMNRKFQETAAERKALQEIADQIKNAAQPQRPPVSPRDFYAQQHAFVKNEVARTLQYTPDEMQTLGDDVQFWPIEAQLAYQDVRDRLKVVAQRQTEQQAHAVALRANIEAIEAELKAADSGAFEYAINKIKNGEIMEKDKAALREAVQKADKKVVTEFFNKFREEFRGVKQPPKQEKQPAKAPVLEGSGGPPAQQTGVALDAVFMQKFRDATPREKVSMLSQWRKSQQK